MEQNIGLADDIILYLTFITVLIVWIIAIAEYLWGPSEVTEEAEKRLYQEDLKESRKRFEAAVQAEMNRIRRTSP